MRRFSAILILALLTAPCCAQLPALLTRQGTESNLTLDGKAGLWTTPQGLGPNTDVITVGLLIDGTNADISHAVVSQVQGPAVVVRGAGHIVSDIRVLRSVAGFSLEAPDSKYRGLYTDETAKDGLTVTGTGTVIIGDHICGSQTCACRIKAPSELHACYHEAAPIGTDICAGADETQIDGLNIGPGTCWQRGLRIGASGCRVVGIKGTVPAHTEVHPSPVGIEVMPGQVHEFIEGQLLIAPGSHADGLILRGDRQTVNLRGGWLAKADNTFVRASGKLTGCDLTIKGSGDGGCVFDATQAELVGCRVRIDWSGSAQRVRGKIPAGNEVVQR